MAGQGSGQRSNVKLTVVGRQGRVGCTSENIGRSSKDQLTRLWGSPINKSSGYEVPEVAGISRYLSAQTRPAQCVQVLVPPAAQYVRLPKCPCGHLGSCSMLLYLAAGG